MMTAKHILCGLLLSAFFLHYIYRQTIAAPSGYAHVYCSKYFSQEINGSTVDCLVDMFDSNWTPKQCTVRHDSMEYDFCGKL